MNKEMNVMMMINKNRKKILVGKLYDVKETNVKLYK